MDNRDRVVTFRVTPYEGQLLTKLTLQEPKGISGVIRKLLQREAENRGLLESINQPPDELTDGNS